MPVLATTIGSPPLVAPTPPFRADLAGAAAAPIALAPLGHGRGLDAPSGLAKGVARPATPYETSSSDLPQAKRRHGPPAASAAEPQVGAANEGPVGDIQRAPDQVAPIRHAPVVANAQPSKSLIVASGVSLPVAPRGEIGRPQGSGAGVQRSAQSSSKDSTTVESSVQVKPPTPDPAPTRSDGAAPSRLTLGQARRLGLGAPIDPVVFRAQRAAGSPANVAQPAAPAMPLLASPRPTSIDRPQLASPKESVVAAPGPTPSSPPQSASPDAPSTAQLRGPAPEVPIAAHADARRPSSSVVLPATARSSSHEAPRATRTDITPKMSPARPAPAPRVTAVAPLLGSRPIAQRVQRAPLTSSVPAATDTGTASKSVEGQVRVHRGSEATELAGALEARAFTHGGEVYLPASHGPLGAPKAQSLLAHELTHVAQQRRFGSSLPHEESAEGRQLEAQAVAAESGHPLALNGSRDGRDKAGQGEAAQSETTKATPETATVQLAAADPAAPQRASANDARFTDPDAAFRDKLESNEEYLFSHFERRLRHNLIHERERGGTLIDAL